MGCAHTPETCFCSAAATGTGTAPPGAATPAHTQLIWHNTGTSTTAYFPDHLQRQGAVEQAATMPEIGPICVQYHHVRQARIADSLSAAAIGNLCKS